MQVIVGEEGRSAVRVAGGPPSLRFSVLGPLLVEHEDGPIRVAGVKERVLLCSLLARNGHALSVDELIDALWSSSPPPSAAKSLQAHVVRLRDALEADRPRGAPGGLIRTSEGGYAIAVPPETLDSARFESALVDARTALRAGASATSVELLTRALAEWRGRPFAGLSSDLLEDEADRLEELRRQADEDLAEAQLASGLHRDILARLEQSATAEPLRERRWAQLMLAFYRAGQQADALVAFKRARDLLVEELGIEPGEELQQLQLRILEQDPSLTAGLSSSGPGGLPVPLQAPPTIFSGRESELSEMLGWWDAAEPGAAFVGAVLGEAGIGKTRLAAELATRVAGTPAIVHASGLPESSESLAILRRVAAAIDRPEMLAPNVSPEGAGAAVGTALARLTARDGLLLVLDDLSEPSDATLAALAALLTRLQPTRALVLLLGRGLPAEIVPGRALRTIELRPLALPETVAIVGEHVAQDDATLAASDIAAVARGVPGLVHREAAAWARRQARRRVGAAASRAAAGRQALRDARRHLVRELAGWQELGGPAARGAAAQANPLSDDRPYKGLAHFEVEDASYFFGREDIVHDLVGRLAEGSFIGVVGPSGSGKSSLVRAGLLAALAGGILPGSESWPWYVLIPGARPLDELAALRRDFAPAAPRRLLLIDQLERLFSDCDDAAERRRFLDELAGMVGSSDGSTAVVAVMRADYYGHLTLSPAFAGLMAEANVVVGAMTADEVQRAVELPARRVGIQLDAGLPAAIATEIAGRSGALPLLSTALLELWERRSGKRLSWSAYRRIGGVRGAVARLAESAYDRLSEEERAVAKRILLRTAGSTEAPTEQVARRVPLTELDSEGDAGRRVLATLTERRLVTIDAGVAEVTHESLYREWPRLREWLDEDRHGRELHRHVTVAAREWDRRQRDPAELYRGARLAAALAWLSNHPEAANTLEREFVQASELEAQREAEGARDQARRTARVNLWLRWAASGLAATVVIALIAAVVATQLAATAEREALAAEAARQAGIALREDHLDRSLLLAAEAFEVAPSVDTRGTLLSALLRSPAAVRILRTEDERFLRSAMSPDGRIVAESTNSGTIHLWDWQQGRVTHVLEQSEEAIFFVGFTGPDEVSAAAWAPGSWILNSWNAATGESVLDTRLPGSLAVPLDVWFSPGAATVVSGGAAKVVRVSLADGSTTDLGTFEGEFWGSHMSADASRLAIVTPDATQVWDGAGRLLWTLDYAGQPRFSADGTRLAMALHSGEVVLLDGTSGEELARSVVHVDEVVSLEFSLDGRKVASTAGDGGVAVWDTATGSIERLERGHASTALALSFTPDGRTLISAGRDSTAVAWDLAGDRRFGRGVAQLPDELTDFARGPEGLLVSTHASGRLTVADLDAGWQHSVDLGLGPLNTVGLLPDGRTAIVGAESGQLLRVDTAADPPSGEELLTHARPIGTLALAPDGHTLVIGALNGVLLLDLAADQPKLAALAPTWPVWSLAFDPAGKKLAAGFEGGTARVWQWPERTELATLDTSTFPVTGLGFDSTGELLAAGTADGHLVLWEVAGATEVRRLRQVHAGFVLGVAFSPDGQELITSGTDGTLAVHEVSSGQKIGSPLAGIANTWMLFEHDPPSSLFGVQDNGAVWSWPLATSAWEDHVCSVVGRQLTANELAAYLPGRAESRACRAE